MEENWGRERDYLRFGLSEINGLLGERELEAAESAKLVEEGKANTTYVLGFAGGERRILRLFQNPPVAQRVESLVSSNLLDAPWAPRICFSDSEICLLEWKAGVTLERLISGGRQAEVLSAAQGIGAALARISQVRFPRAGFLGGEDALEVTEPWKSAMSGLRGYLDMCLDRPVVLSRAGALFISNVRSMFDRNTMRLEEAAGPVCLVHGDYKASNLLIDDGRLSAVLDWEFAHSGTVLHSIGQVLRHEEALPAGFANRFAAGFESAGGDLPKDWRRLSRIIDIVNLADFIGREGASTNQIADCIRIVDGVFEEDHP